MSNQYLKLRRSGVPGKIPSTSSIDYGEIALNTYDGLAFMKKSGSNGEEVVPIGSNSGSFSGSFQGTFSGSLYGTASWAENYNETDPIFTAVSGTLATTGSNTFYGLQTISASTDLSALDIHVKDDILWAFRIYNDAYSSSSIGLASWIDNDGVSFLGTENDKPLHIYNDANYYNPALLISSSGVTVGDGGITGSLHGTASWAENAIAASSSINSISASIAQTASFAPAYLPLTGGTINGDVTLNGTASISFLNVTIQSSSVIYSSGSNVFGDSTQDTQTLVGAVLVSGSQSITGSLNVSQGITGSLLGTSSWAEYAQTASFISPLGNAFVQGGNSFGTTALLGTNDNRNLQIETSGSVRMTISSSGDVGIGTATPEAPLHLQATAIPSTNERILRMTVSDGGGAYLDFRNGSVTNGTFTPNIVGRQVNNVLSGLIVEGAITDTQDVNSTTPVTIFRSSKALTGGSQTQLVSKPLFEFRNWSDTVMFIGAMGEVGIGTTTPTAKLDVSGSGRFTNGLTVTGSLNSPTITGSLFGTSSWALNAVNALNAATASNILGGKAPHVPFFITDTTLATSSIYQSGSSTVIINQDAATTANPEALYVWQPSTSSFNVISGKGNLDNYLQLNVQNTNQGANASSDIVATANNGNESVRYVNMGINNENYAGFLGGPNDAYLYNTGEDFWIGNYSDGKNVYFFNSASANPLITLTPSNTVDINTTLNATDITGSLYGTASWARNTVSASHAVNADFAGFAQNAAVAANGGVTQIVAGSGVSLIPATGVGNVTVIATGVGGVTILSGSNVTESFANSATWAFTHSLGTRTPVISVFDSNYNQVIPESIQLIDTASAIITFPTLESGFAVATVGGVTGNALSSSYSLFATYADTASYYAETDPIFVARSASLATTGSNVFRGTQTITGSVNITGSTTQTGNNTLIGNTTLSGSINVSGSQTFNGSSSFYGTHELSGSNTIRGNTFMFGNIQVSGSSNFNNSEFIITGSTSILGDLNVKGTSVFSNTTFTVTGSQYFTGSSFINGNQSLTGNSTVTGSLNVIGDINVVSGSSFTRWGNKLFNYGAFSDTTTQTGPQNTILSMSFNTTDIGGAGVSVVDNTKITVNNTGIYNLQFSAQFDRTTSGTNTATVWFAYTGSSIPNSATDILIAGTAANNPVVASWNYVLPMSASSYVEIYWSHDDNEADKVELKAIPARTGPVRPAVPSVIATLTQIA